MQKLSITGIPPTNSKGIDTRIIDETGAQVAIGRFDDCVRVMADFNRLNSAPVAMEAYSGYYVAHVMAKVRLQGRDYYKEITIGYSPENIDLTGNGQNLFVNVSGSMLTACYVAPKALPLVDSQGLVRTQFGVFRVAMKSYERATVEKVA